MLDNACTCMYYMSVNSEANEGETKMTILKAEALGKDERGMVMMRALVSCAATPNAKEVAEMAGYHPYAYRCYDAKVEPAVEGGIVRFGEWAVEWKRFDNCG